MLHLRAGRPVFATRAAAHVPPAARSPVPSARSCAHRGAAVQNASAQHRTALGGVPHSRGAALTQRLETTRRLASQTSSSAPTAQAPPPGHQTHAPWLPACSSVLVGLPAAPQTLQTQQACLLLSCSSQHFFSPWRSAVVSFYKPGGPLVGGDGGGVGAGSRTLSRPVRLPLCQPTRTPPGAAPARSLHRQCLLRPLPGRDRGRDDEGERRI